MKISYDWLKTYADFNLGPAELAGILTNTGLEVEGMEDFESVKGALEGIVVGEVLTCNQHPNADRLSVTRVDVGKGQILPIVCGAPNVAAGQKVAVALPGTTLHMGEESITLKKTKIRGEVSEGMICAEDELGLGEDHAGILVLDAGLTPGQPLTDVFPVVRDTVFEIGLTPNRIDGASHIGTARDIVAYLNLDDQATSLKRPDVSGFSQDNHDMTINVEVRNEEACLRYSGVCLSDIKVAESPDWLKARLKAIGLNPINNIVDVTNFVLHETGQPLHAFDAEYITGNQVIVDTLPAGTIFKTLDEQDRKLTDNDLMICNSEEGMCIGGVFGGIKSGVSEKTTRIFLESACFNPVWIRKTAKEHGISTDSSFRFERGTDPNGTLYALKRAALLMREVAGAKIASPVTDIYPTPVKPYPVTLSWANLNRLVGIEIPRDTVKQILNLLDINIVHETPTDLQLEVATYRVDVKREADVVEEILRIYGYNNVGISEQVLSPLSFAPNPDPEVFENRIATQLTGMGFLEVMSNSLTKSQYYSALPGQEGQGLVELLNPLSNDLKAMRKSLVFGVLEAVKLNISHRKTNLRGFEFGNTYEITKIDKAYLADSYQETRRLALFVTGQKTAEHWSVTSEDSSIFQLKSVVTNILRSLAIPSNNLTVAEFKNSIWQEGLQYLHGERLLASVGLVNKKLLQDFDIDQPVFFAEFNWDALLRTYTGQVKYHELPKYPEVRRDLALVLDEERTFEEIRQLAFQVERKLLKQVNLFDVFRSEKLGSNKKSYAVSFILQDESKTLNDKQIDKIMGSLLSAFQNKLQATLR